MSDSTTRATAATAYRWPVRDTDCTPGNQRPHDADRCQRCGGGLFHQDPALVRSEKTGFARRDIVEWAEQRWLVEGREVVGVAEVPAGRVVTGPDTAATDAQVAEVGRAVCDLADLIAKNRTGGAVFMGGEHLPRPSEERAAREFIAELLNRGWRLPDGT